MKIEFEAIPPAFDEFLTDDNFSYEAIENIAYEKALSVAQNIEESAWIVAGDTVVVYAGKILGKPADKADSIRMLTMLSDNSHQVVTSLCLLDSETKNKLISTTQSKVKFNYISAKQILEYVEQYNPLDKAGAYGLQELPDGFVKKVIGPKDNVIGLPCDTLRNMLNFFGKSN